MNHDLTHLPSATEVTTSTNIRADIGDWLTPTWSRFTAFPYQHLQALSFNFEAVYTCIVATIWCEAVSGCCVFNLVMLPDMPSSSLEMAEVWLLFLFAVFAAPIRVLTGRWEGILATIAREKQARYLWASSFWDEDKTRKILSRSHWTVSLGPQLTDLGLATISTLKIALARREGVSGYHQIMIAQFAAAYSIRCAFSQLRASVVVLQHSSPAPSTLVQAIFVVRVDALFQAWIVILGVLLGGYLAWVSWDAFSFLRELLSSQEDGAPSWFPLVVLCVITLPSYALFLCALLDFAGYQLRNLVTNTVWRVYDAYSSDG